MEYTTVQKSGISTSFNKNLTLLLLFSKYTLNLAKLKVKAYIHTHIYIIYLYIYIYCIYISAVKRIASKIKNVVYIIHDCVLCIFIMYI